MTKNLIPCLLITLLSFCAGASAAHFISSAGCTSNDRLHCNSEESRGFGKRYGEKMLSVLRHKISESK